MSVDVLGTTETNAEAYGSIRTAQDGRLDSHTAPELCDWMQCVPNFVLFRFVGGC